MQWLRFTALAADSHLRTHLQCLLIFTGIAVRSDSCWFLRGADAVGSAAAFTGMHRSWAGASVLVVQDPAVELVAGLAVLQV